MHTQDSTCLLPPPESGKAMQLTVQGEERIGSEPSALLLLFAIASEETGGGGGAVGPFLSKSWK